MIANKREMTAPIQTINGAYSIKDFPQIVNETKNIVAIINRKT